VVLYGPFSLLFEIIPSVDSTGGTVWAVLLLFEIIPSVDSTSGNEWAVLLLFEIIPSVDSTSGNEWAVFSCCILVSSPFKSVYCCSLSVMVGIAASTECASLMVLSSLTMSGLSLWTILSVITDLPLYSLWLQFSNTDCGSFL